jgi:hypothetical protein
MFSIIDRFKRPQCPTPTPAPTPVKAPGDAMELLGSCSLPDPNHLRRELAAVEAQLAADDAAWDRLDRTSNPRAFTEQQAIAGRRPSLDAEHAALRRRVVAAERSRAAFVALVDILDALDLEIAEAAQRLYADVMIVSKGDRHACLESLDGLVRARARIAGPLALVAPAPRFRRAPDPFATLAENLRARADEIDRLHAPGMPRPSVTWPDGAQELIAALNQGRSA